MSELNPGLVGCAESVVTSARTAIAMGSGTLPVYATPAMLALMEQAAAQSVEDAVGEGCTTVGTSLAVRHVAATPEGMKVRCESTLTAVDGRRLVFTVKAYDEAGLIGEGTHERFVVNREKFMAKTKAKTGA